MFNNVGFIGSGPLTQALAPHLVTAQMQVLISNSRGPDSLTELVAELGDAAQAVTWSRRPKPTS
jgi:8-hydroxy-5-deazaflavin:NADPH oxidoreductase